MQAVDALRVAEQACTADHPEAQAKIAALLVRCRAAQGSSSSSSGTAPTSAGAGSESRLLSSSAPTDSAGRGAVQRPPSALGTLKESASSDRLDSEGSQRAQEAYSAAYQLLQRCGAGSQRMCLCSWRPAKMLSGTPWMHTQLCISCLRGALFIAFCAPSMCCWWGSAQGSQ